MMVSEFSDLKNKLSDDNQREVAKSVEKLAGALPNQRSREQAYIIQAKEIRRSEETSSESTEAALEVQKQANRTSASRSRVFNAVNNYTYGETSGAEAAKTVGEALTVHSSLETKAQKMETAIEEGQLGPVIHVEPLPTQSVLLGESLSMTTKVENLGGSSLEDVSLSLDSPDGSDVSIGKTEVGTLEPKEDVQVTITATPAADIEIGVDAKASGQSDSSDTQITVRSFGDIIGESLTSVFELLKHLRGAYNRQSPSGQNAGGKGGKKNEDGKGAALQSFEAKLEKTTKSITTAYDRMQSQKSDSAVEGSLESGKETLDAFINQIEAQSGKSIPENDAGQLVYDAQSLIEQLDAAKLMKFH